MSIRPTWEAVRGTAEWVNTDAPGYRIKDVPGGYEVYQGEQLLESPTFFAEAVAAVEIAVEQAKAELAEMGEA